MFIHVIFYYKYTTFHKFPIDWTDELCDILDGKRTSFVTERFVNKIIDDVKHDGPLKCPLFGVYSLKLDNVSMSIFDVPSLMPAGRYRIDTNFTEKNPKNIFAFGSTRTDISDHRIEQF